MWRESSRFSFTAQSLKPASERSGACRMNSFVPVTIILPTHNHPSTLPYSIDSVLAQTFADFRLVVIGDGASDETRDLVASAAMGDQRIEFLDRPKSARTGEEYRAEVLATTESSVVGYHGDDDLLLPEHLEIMLGLLAGHDFAHPLPIFVNEAGRLVYIPSDISQQEWIDWHLPPTGGNAITLTGAVHTLDAYRRLPHGWRTTPQGRPTDHYMWQQFFELPGFSGVTGTKATAVKLDASRRGAVEARDRALEIKEWTTRVARPDFPTFWLAAVNQAVREEALSLALDRFSRIDAQERMQKHIDTLEDQTQTLKSENDQCRNSLRESRGTIANMRASKSWRLTAPLRKTVGRARRARRQQRSDR